MSNFVNSHETWRSAETGHSAAQTNKVKEKATVLRNPKRERQDSRLQDERDAHSNDKELKENL